MIEGRGLDPLEMSDEEKVQEIHEKLKKLVLMYMKEKCMERQQEIHEKVMHKRQVVHKNTLSFFLGFSYPDEIDETLLRKMENELQRALDASQ